MPSDPSSPHPPSPARTIVVVGAGVIGAGFAQRLAAAGHTVRLHDRDADALGRARERVEHGRYGVRRAVELGKLVTEEADATLERLQLTDDIEAALAGEVDVVIEAVWEDLALKASVFRTLDRVAPAGTILTSTTSGFPIASLAGATERPELVLGWHPASPVVAMHGVEIIRHRASDEAAVERVCEIARSCGQRTYVINDNQLHWGFVASRLFMTLHREARSIVADGIATEQDVDGIVRDTFRWPAGPFELVERASRNWEGRPKERAAGESISRNAELLGVDARASADEA